MSEPMGSEGSVAEAPPVLRALLLSRAGLFSSLDAATLVQLASCAETLLLPEGSVVVRQGELAECVYVVSEGSFGVFVTCEDCEEETRVGTIGPGQCIGEMALLTDEPRSATVRAEGSGKLLRLERARFVDLLVSHPNVALGIISSLCGRLRAANEVVVRLTDAARAMAEDRLTQEAAAELEKATGADEFSQLSQVFGQMAQQVMVREEQLRREVQQLRIEIDVAKSARQVAEITETKYFQDLQRKAKERRAKRRAP